MRSFVLPIAIGIILAAFGWWLNQDRYDVRYTLSEKIPLSFGSGQQEAVQQLEVKNLSRKEVEKVQVKLPPRVTQHELFKNSQADSEQIFTRPTSFELLYAALPPQGSFRLVFKTTGAGISKYEVQVSHSRGSAQEALADVSSLTSIFMWLGAGLFLFYIWQVLIQFRDFSVRDWKHDAEYQSEKVLRASKPIYIPRERWKEIRDTAITKFGEFDRYRSLMPSDIANLPIYRYLNSEKPEHLSEEEWQQFLRIKTQQFLAAFNARIAESWTSTDELLTLLKVKKPIQFPFDKWEEWQESIQKRFIARQLQDDPFNVNVVAKIQQSKPDEVSSTRWNEYQDKLAERWFANLSTEMEILIQESPLEFLNRQNLQVLKQDQVQRLRKRAYRLQMTSLPDLTNEESARSFLQDAKPTWISKDDYKWHKARAERTLRVADGDRTNAVERERICRESAELAEVKEKVLKQLAILHELLVDPASIDRIEPYDNPFAPGNLEVLKRISLALRDGG